MTDCIAPNFLYFYHIFRSMEEPDTKDPKVPPISFSKEQINILLEDGRQGMEVTYLYVILAVVSVMMVILGMVLWPCFTSWEVRAILIAFLIIPIIWTTISVINIHIRNKQQCAFGPEVKPEQVKVNENVR